MRPEDSHIGFLYLYQYCYFENWCIHCYVSHYKTECLLCSFVGYNITRYKQKTFGLFQNAAFSDYSL